jgi:transposase InsO family protein
VDLFRCESILLRSYWVLVVMDQFTRRLVGIGVHCGPVAAADLCGMFNAAIHGQGAPRHLSTDHDPLFDAHRWMANLRILEIDEIKTRAARAFVAPVRGAIDGDDTERISRPGPVLERPRPGTEAR